MKTPFPPKTPMQMRREAERNADPRPPIKLGDVDAARRPPLAPETPRDYAATRDWLAHIAAGRIPVR